VIVKLTADETHVFFRSWLLDIRMIQILHLASITFCVSTVKRYFTCQRLSTRTLLNALQTLNSCLLKFSCPFVIEE